MQQYCDTTRPAYPLAVTRFKVGEPSCLSPMEAAEDESGEGVRS